MLTRRQLLLSTLIGGAALVGLTLAIAPGDDAPAAPAELKFLNGDDVLVLTALIPALLDGALATEPMQRSQQIQQLLIRFDQALLHLYPRTQAELRQLLDLLTNKAGRVAVAGVWSNWANASLNDKQQFLNHWRDSFLDLLQTAYSGLHNLVMASFYGDPANWALAGYAGPPTVR
ncbi:twin-arginine translocation pathway signal protein [Permianibacter sp. IMCC34836]|uniref:twin-arginine translocation pathway signal protein n=1 Tax=Permianibacter fluminis TaxID=2738515 RepID=UPI0015523CB8|nr:twin-arginine translocation pathway signal protein [Permianibacter fluminis]NQD36302.1 twin-arginine translocation pathway signal protein [Permianibacter fluminis]